MESIRTPLILLVLALIVGGASYFTTDVRQLGEVERLRESRLVAERATARVEDLRAQEVVSKDAAEAALNRWHSRYKYIPAEMNSADVVEYLRDLTGDGFDAFNFKLNGTTESPDFSKIMVDVEGTGEFEALHHVIWHLENNRELYRVHDLEMEYVNESIGAGAGPLRDLVRFSFELEAFYGEIEGIRAPEADLVPVPTGLLLPHTASRDIFAPIVRIPTNATVTSVAAPGGEAGSGPVAETPAQATERATPVPTTPDAPPDGLDIATATLKLVVGDQAVFEDRFGRSFTVRVGDDVLGGEVETVNAARGIVRARIVEDGRERLVVRTLGDRPAER